MKMQRFFGTLAIVSLLAACSDSVGVTDGDPLTELESEAIATELLDGVFSGFAAGLSGSSAQSPSLSQVPVTFSLAITHVEACEGSGTINLAVSMDGTFDDQTGDGNLSLEIVETMNDCGVTVGNILFTVNGNPNITMIGEFTVSGEDVSGTFAFDGGFSYTSADGRVGSCGVNVDIVFTPTSLSYQGQVCNTTIDFSATIGV
ncbi:MAG: hypothetical protein O7I93_03675 [Gemmatimonadetes bacterium]|nr:hypothetical protein [Gemmatimonadota bacterium]